MMLLLAGTLALCLLPLDVVLELALVAGALCWLLS